MAEQNDGELKYPQVFCEKCKTEMKVIGVGTATGRLQYHCDTCGEQRWGRHLDAMRVGSLGGRARAAVLTPEKRQAIAEKAGNAYAEKMRERRKNQ